MPELAPEQKKAPTPFLTTPLVAGFRPGDAYKQMPKPDYQAELNRAVTEVLQVRAAQANLSFLHNGLTQANVAEAQARGGEYSSVIVTAYSYGVEGKNAEGEYTYTDVNGRIHVDDILNAFKSSDLKNLKVVQSMKLEDGSTVMVVTGRLGITTEAEVFTQTGSGDNPKIEGPQKKSDTYVGNFYAVVRVSPDGKTIELHEVGELAPGQAPPKIDTVPSNYSSPTVSATRK